MKDEMNFFDELKLEKCLFKERLIPSRVKLYATLNAQASEFNNYYVRKSVPEQYFVNSYQNITDEFHHDYVYLHFGSSKDVALNETNFPFSCLTPIPSAYRTTFDGFYNTSIVALN